MSEVYRSGFSDPADIFVSNNFIPEKPTNLIVKESGVQKTEAPNEKVAITLEWEAPKSFDLSVEQGKGDNIFSKDDVGNVDGTYSTNDTSIATKNDLTTDLAVGDKINIGDDPTIYTITGINASGFTILYGLLMDISVDNLPIYLLTKTHENPEDSMLLTYNYKKDTDVEIYGFGGFDYRGKWIDKGEDLEWEDLNKVGYKISNSNLKYWVKDSGNTLESDALVNSYSINLINTSTNLNIGDKVSFAPDYGVFYTISEVDDTQITFTSKITTSYAAGTGIWIDKEEINNYQTDLNTEDFYGKTKMDILSGYTIYYKFDEALSEADHGEELIKLPLSKISVNSKGKSSYVYNADSDDWYSRKVFFGISAYDGNGNNSDLEASAWCITAPGQAEILSSDLDTLTNKMTITYKNITDGGLNPHLAEQMGEDTTSINGGYNVFLVDYKEADKVYYQGVSITKGRVRSTSLMAGDVVHIYDIFHAVKWTSHCLTNGYVDISNDQVISGGSLDTYLGAKAPQSGDVKVHYLRVDDRENQTVLDKDINGNVKYLTDSNNTYELDIDGGKSQGVVMESVDLNIGSGVEH